MATRYASSSDDDESDEDFELLLVAAVDVQARRVNRTCWVKPWLTRRDELGTFHTLHQELRAEEPPLFANCAYANLTGDWVSFLHADWTILTNYERFLQIKN